jgi:hypothetical protein
MKYPRDVLHFYAIVKPPDVILKESLAVALRVQKRATPVAPSNKQAVRELKRWLSGSPGVLPLP